MKQLFMAMVFAVLSLNQAQAQTIKSSEILTYNGAAQSAEVGLTGEKRRTVYETVTVSRTCSRQVYAGTYNVCNTHYEQVCTVQRLCPNRPGTLCRDERVCHSAPRQYCTLQSQYRTEYYTCYQQETRPVGTERVYLVDAKIALNFEGLRTGSANEQVVVQVVDGDVSVATAKTSGKVLLFKTEALESNLSNGVKTVTGQVTIKAVVLADAVAPVNSGISGGKVEGTRLVFNVGRIEHLDLLKVALELEREKFLANKDLFNGTVPANLIEVRTTGSSSEVIIDLAKLPLAESFEKAKYKAKLELSVARTKGLMNPGLLGSGSAKSEVKFERK